jgi:sulfur carrier protein
MDVTVELVGEGPRTVEVPEDATVADLVAPLPVSVHEVSVVVDGRTLPADSPVPDDATQVRVVRLIKGG